MISFAVRHIFIVVLGQFKVHMTFASHENILKMMKNGLNNLFTTKLLFKNRREKKLRLNLHSLSVSELLEYGRMWFS
jgi:hypothetical protein